jgi:hypothetical protein
MIEGITVLSQEAAVDFNATVFFGLLLVFVIIGAVVSVATDSNGLGVGLVLACMLIFAMPAAYNESETRFRYECTIDESVSMTDVYERFEIIERRGDIWVLEDKE